MPLHTVSSWRELDDAITDAGRRQDKTNIRSTLVFRGLSRASYTNTSSLARLDGDYPSLEPHLLRNFRKYAHRERPGPTTWDWLSLGQHHGLPTRLLDWTFSPLVALHFATAAWSDEDAVLCAVDAEAAHELLPARLRCIVEDERALVFTTEQLAEVAPGLPELDALSEDDPFLLFFEPPSLDTRIINQAAVLSVISDPRCDLETWLEDHEDLWQAWRIPAEVKGEIRERLDQANVTERVLLPGLDGLAAWLRRYYSLRPIADDGGAFMDDGALEAAEEGAMR